MHGNGCRRPWPLAVLWWQVVEERCWPACFTFFCTKCQAGLTDACTHLNESMQDSGTSIPMNRDPFTALKGAWGLFSCSDLVKYERCSVYYAAKGNCHNHFNQPWHPVQETHGWRLGLQVPLLWEIPHTAQHKTCSKAWMEMNILMQWIWPKATNNSGSNFVASQCYQFFSIGTKLSEWKYMKLMSG